jgi:pyruvate dehydrogenase E2 component (dihydrolipoamide acetyltransferase)
MAEFVMPSLGADMDEGTLVEWMVKVGDTVHKGDIVAVVDTTKSAIEVEVFTDGVVEELLVEPGTTVPVGTPLAHLGPAGVGAGAWAGAGEAPPAPEPQPPSPGMPEPAEAPSSPAPEPAVASPIVRHLAHEKGIDLASVPGTGRDGLITRHDVEAALAARDGSPAPPAAVPASVPGPEPPSALSSGARPKASPRARRLAAERGVDLATVPGSGPGGAITAADVEKAGTVPPARKARPALKEPAAGTPAEAAKTRAAAMRQTIAGLMARSKREIPHYYLRTTVDFSAADAFLRRHNAEVPVGERLLPAVVLLKASALAIRKVPEMNGFFVDGAFARSEHIHLGVAVSLRGGGLVAPAIHDADTLSLPELMVALKDLVARTRAGRLRGSQMSDPTITVTNMGEQGVELVHGVIYPPQVALVGFGKVVSRPWAVDGMLTVRPVVAATLSADHRVSDGHRGGLYLAAVDDLLQRPEEL